MLRLHCCSLSLFESSSRHYINVDGRSLLLALLVYLSTAGFIVVWRYDTTIAAYHAEAALDDAIRYIHTLAATPTDIGIRLEYGDALPATEDIHC